MDFNNIASWKICQKWHHYSKDICSHHWWRVWFTFLKVTFYILARSPFYVLLYKNTIECVFYDVYVKVIIDLVRDSNVRPLLLAIQYNRLGGCGAMTHDIDYY